MPERSCPSCHEPVATHQTLCPVCRTPVPSEAGPVAAESTAFTFSAPPPRRSHEGPAPAEPAPAWAPPTESAPAEPAPAWAPPTESAPAEPAPAWAPPTESAPAEPAPAWAPPTEGPSSAGTLGRPGAAVLDERGNLPGGLVGLVAAALVTIGVFLPWIGVEGRNVSGWAASADAKVLLGVAGLATLTAALLIGGARSLVLRILMGVLGVVAVGLAVFEVLSANGIDDFDVSPGIGLVLVMGGGLALAASGALTRHRRFRPA